MRLVLKSALIGERVIDEWPLFDCRVDVAVIRPQLLTAYEIKSPADSLTRLRAQVQDYGRVFDVCYLVTTDHHASAAMEILPDWWGIALVAADQLFIARSPGLNPDLDVRVLVHLLWVRELRQALQQRRIIPEIAKRIAKRRLVELALDHVPARDLRPLVCQTLLNRGPSWRPADEDELRKIRGGATRDAH